MTYSIGSFQLDLFMLQPADFKQALLAEALDCATLACSKDSRCVKSFVCLFLSKEGANQIKKINDFFRLNKQNILFDEIVDLHKTLFSKYLLLVIASVLSHIHIA